jgi:O-antigen ligase
MKRKPAKKPEGPRIRLLELVFPLVPFLALIPNFYQVPLLTYQGLSTQEFVLSTSVAIILALALVVLFRTQTPTRINRESGILLALLGLFIIWQSLSLLWSPDWTEGLHVGGLWFCFAILVITGLFALSSKSAEWLYYSMTVVTLILAGGQFLEYRMFGDVTRGLFFNHGITSELLALVLPLQIVLFLTTPRRSLLILSSIALCTGTAALLMTLRRGAILGMVVALVLIGLSLATKLLRAQHRIRLAVIGIAIVVGIGGLLLFRREQLITRLRSAVTIQVAAGGAPGEYGLTSRMTKWITTWEAAKHNFVFGLGVGGFPARYSEYRRYFVENPQYAKWAAASEPEDYDEVRNPYAHNEYLQILAELGIIGLVLLCAFWWVVARILWRARGSADATWILGTLYGLAVFGISSAMSPFSMRVSPPAIMAACLTSLGLAKARASEVREISTGAQITSWQLPRAAVLSALVAILLLAVLLGLRSNDVLESQKTQSQVDFQFSLDSPSYNESLLRRYDQSLSLDPANAGAHLGRALLLYQLKRPAEAATDAEYALQHSYSRPFTPLLLAFSYEQTNNLDRAAAVLEDCLKSFPKSIVVRAAYAAILDEQGKHDQAESVRAELLKLDQRVGKSWMLALKLKEPVAKEEARRQNLIEPGLLDLMLVKSIVLARAYHYLTP